MGLEGVEPGRLIALASFGVHDDVLPQMAGTALDRAVDLRPEWLYKLAYLAANPSAETESEWADALGDIGLREGNGLLVPAIGIDRLLDALKVHTERTEASDCFRDLVDAVDRLARLSHDAEETLKDRKPRHRTLDGWGKRLWEAASEVGEKLQAMLQEANASGREG